MWPRPGRPCRGLDEPAATFVVSALCLARMRVGAEPTAVAMPGRPAGHEPFLAGLRRGWDEVRSRTWLPWGLVAMSTYHVFVLPSVFVLGPALAEEQLNGASSWAAIVACFGIGGVLGNVVALRLPLRRPVFTAALALVGASTQAAIIGSGLGTVGIAGLELLAGVCVALFFTLWDLSIQEQIPAPAVSRVSAYDFSVSMGLMPLGMAMAGPIADALGLQATLLGMSAVGLAERSPGSPSRRCAACAARRPEPPPQDRPAARPTGEDPRGRSSAPAGGSALRRRSVRVVAHQPARPVQAHRPLDALERARARRRPAVTLADRVADLAGGQHAAGPGDRGHAAGQVDRAPVPVAGAAERGPAAMPTRSCGKSSPSASAASTRSSASVEHRVRVGADEHRGVADRLDQAHVAAQALGGELDQAVGDAPELVGRDLLAQAGEADEVGEADRDVARARQRARQALGRVDGLRAHRLAQVQAGHVLEHRPDHRHEARDASA